MTAVRNNIFISLLILSLPFICFAAETPTVQFPNEGIAAVSPNGKYSVYSMENPSGKTNHVLMIEDTVSKKKWSVYKFDRHVVVIWSPDGNRLIINDHGLSNQSDCVLYDVNKRGMESIWKIVESNVDEKQALTNHHAYLTCSRWLANDRVEVALSAYGDINPDGIDKVGDYIVGSNKIKLKIVRNREQ